MSTSILIIEDEKAIREMIRFALQREGHAVLEAADAMNELPAIPARCTPANAIRFYEGDRVAALSQRQCGRNARESRADDTDICSPGALKYRVVRGLGDRCCIVGSGVFLALMDFLHVSFRVS